MEMMRELLEFNEEERHRAFFRGYRAALDDILDIIDDRSKEDWYIRQVVLEDFKQFINEVKSGAQED